MQTRRWLPDQPTLIGRHDWPDEMDEGTHLRLRAGALVVLDRRAWRVLEITGYPGERWPEAYEKAWRDHVELWWHANELRRFNNQPVKPASDRTDFYKRPVVLVLRDENLPRSAPKHWCAPASQDWQVLPEHYAVCRACGELPPCHHGEYSPEGGPRVPEQSGGIPLLVPEGCCMGCAEQIKPRMRTVRFPGPNLWYPDLGEDTAVFHARATCEDQVAHYRAQWQSEYPQPAAHPGTPAFPGFDHLFLPRARHTHEAPQPLQSPQSPQPLLAPQTPQAPHPFQAPQSPQALQAPQTPSLRTQQPSQTLQAPQSPQPLQSPQALLAPLAPPAPQPSQAPLIPQAPQAPETPMAYGHLTVPPHPQPHIPSHTPAHASAHVPSPSPAHAQGPTAPHPQEDPQATAPFPSAAFPQPTPPRPSFAPPSFEEHRPDPTEQYPFPAPSSAPSASPETDPASAFPTTSPTATDTATATATAAATAASSLAESFGDAAPAVRAAEELSRSLTSPPAFHNAEQAARVIEELTAAVRNIALCLNSPQARSHPHA
ncbi:hypothetical protein ACIQRS_26795 [Streptomyces termitum]|uniref:Uncharacterized protein n=1 Tax=Streptomyces termitum TaxID=67368 RepID=A0A918T6Q1_9ACTN|nr:hypothetical protein [Streptomyces termitum]GHB02720.1 hypothetical protein GCM10010305_52350 [Streptomyces termitum]